MMRSLRPSPYPAAVSMKLTPQSSAACNALTDYGSAWAPHPHPIAQQPKPISEMTNPVLRGFLVFIAWLPS